METAINIATRDVLVITGVILGLYAAYFGLAVLSNRSIRRLSATIQRLDHENRFDLPATRQAEPRPSASITKLAVMAGMFALGLLLFIWLIAPNLGALLNK